MADKNYVERRGGKRPGSGRKKHPKQLLVCGTCITWDQYQLLKKWGGGNASAGIRWLIDVAEMLVTREEPTHPQG